MHAPFSLALLAFALAPAAFAAKPHPKAPQKKVAAAHAKKAPAPEFPSGAGCPKGKKEWLAQGPKILVEKALRQHVPVEIPDFTAKLGKKGGASGSVVPFRGINAPLVMVQAEDKESSVFLSGVLKCVAEKKGPVLVSLTYVKGDKSGLVKVVEE